MRIPVGSFLVLNKGSFRLGLIYNQQLENMKPFLILVLLISTSLSFAQHEFLGQVNSSEGALPYTNIAVKHFNKGTDSDEDSQFRIKLKSTDTLLVSHLGYGTKEVVIFNFRNLEII